MGQKVRDGSCGLNRLMNQLRVFIDSVKQCKSKMEKLSRNARKLIKEARSSGLSDDQIDQCVDKVVQELSHRAVTKETSKKQPTKTSDRPKAKRSARPTSVSRICRCFGILTCAVCLTGLCLFALAMFVTFNRPAEKYIGNLLNPYGYAILRAIRLLTLPLARKYDLSDHYDKNCLLENPLFVAPAVEECSFCNQLSPISVVKKMAQDNFMDNYLNGGQPLQIQTDPKARRVVFDEMKAAFVRNKPHLISRAKQVRSTNQEISSTVLLFENVTVNYIAKDSNFHAEWHSNNVGAAQFLRSFFAKPSFVPSTQEISMEKSFYLDAPNARPYKMKQLLYSNMWYAQGSGSRNIRLYPDGPCQLECRPLTFTLEPGHILYFNTFYWKSKSESNPDSDEVSVSFTGGF